jgi:hypothetical protein
MVLLRVMRTWGRVAVSSRVANDPNGLVAQADAARLIYRPHRRPSRQRQAPADSGSPAPKIRGASPSLRGPPRRLRGRGVGCEVVSDLRRFLDLPADVPAPAGWMADHLTLVVAGRYGRRCRGAVGECALLRPSPRSSVLPRSHRRVPHRHPRRSGGGARPSGMTR